MTYIKWILSEIKQYGFGVAWYNVKFDWAYRALHAKSMKVVTKD